MTDTKGRPVALYLATDTFEEAKTLAALLTLAGMPMDLVADITDASPEERERRIAEADVILALLPLGPRALHGVNHALTLGKSVLAYLCRGRGLFLVDDLGAFVEGVEQACQRAAFPPQRPKGAGEDAGP